MLTLARDVLSYINTNKLDKKAQEAPSPAAPKLASTPPPPLAAPPVGPAAGENYVDIPLTNMRRVIAKRLTESKVTTSWCFTSSQSA